MRKSLFTVRQLTRAAILAALYAALTLLLAPISFGMTGAVQLRVAEALTLLPLLLPEAVPALFTGCLLANLLAGAALPDVVFGSLATLAAALCTWGLRRRSPLVGALPPVVFNGLIVGAVVHYAYTPGIALPLCMLYVALGQAVACYALGIPLLWAARRLPPRLLER
ncbi:MAG: QueT transporter family protein [Oscillospiraceae bacterium]|nr:QueT transporter family protein [Oscillospiraceae bacterium]